MIDFIFGTVWGWVGTAGVVVIVCVVVGYFIPAWRGIVIAIGGIAVSAASIYTKATRDRAALEKRRRDEAVAKARDEYDKIDARPDTPADVARRLREHGF